MKPAPWRRPRIRFLHFLVLGIALLGLQAALAGSWTGTLHDGSVLKIDPETRRPMRYDHGGPSPMWDGTHRLEDGSVVIIRDGTIVPTQSMLETWAAEPGAEPRMRDRHCEQLVRKTCGFHEECATTQPCVLARQLRRLERDEQRRAPFDASRHPPDTDATGECLDALRHAAFPTCAATRLDRHDTPCARLVERVCGPADRCAARPACDPARQLLRMETEERLESLDPSARTATGAECEKARDNAFFQACETAEAPRGP